MDKKNRRMMKKLRFNIHGFFLEIRVNHPRLHRMVVEEFKAFRDKKRSHRTDLRLDFFDLPINFEGKTYPDSFRKYRNLSMPHPKPGVVTTTYGQPLMAVITHLKQHFIESAVAAELPFLPDPAYHYCLTQPMSPWLKKKGLFFLHAGCVAEEGRGILIVGHSRAGKSTLSLKSVQAGFKFLSDEQPLLSFRDGVLRAYSFPRRIRLDHPLAARFRELRPLLKNSKSDRIAFPIETIRRGAVVSSCKPCVLIFPRFEHRKGFQISRMHPSIALAKLLQDDHFVSYPRGTWQKVSQEHLALFERLVKEAPAYDLAYGNDSINRIPSLFSRLLGDGQ